MSQDAFRIRNAVPGDVGEIAALIRELALYEKEPEAAKATEADLLRDGFGPEPYFRCVMLDAAAENASHAVAGFALYFFQYSTWEGRPSLYLEDLFVRPAYRGRGFGKALLQHLAQVAVDRECTRLQWECLDWNTPSLAFYESLGASVLREWLNLRLTGDDIARLAAGLP
ncbi:GNAT family N-acetyltransferase [Terriglobus aquaticus]|uniref:GNAT family N-acetyltransferase n=1 Tax=Terriglobus aquaticus TaxID=940139 RepID=A0ABW9KGM1_9BACT|nr:GNAT family N-acetyltransferase [Terriglobus aquaticus]